MISAPIALLRNLWGRIALRRADILGREQGQTVVRVALTCTVLGYLVASHYPLNFNQGAPGWLIFILAFLLSSVVVATLALRDQQSRSYRRGAANVMDVVAITYIMANTGESGAPLFVLYLWITLGNGFRFGLTAMGISAVLSVVGFAVVMMNVDLWRQHAMLSAGIMVALLVLPAHAAHLIRQLHRARAQAEEASTAKGQVLARMSDKLRAPLNGILGTTELIRHNRWLNAADRELLGVIQESVSVSLHQIEVGKLVLEQTKFDPKGAA